MLAVRLHNTFFAEPRRLSSTEVAAAISGLDFSACAATVIGYGNMGREYLKALQALGVKRIRVCSRSEKRLAELRDFEGITAVSGGFGAIDAAVTASELGIVAIPVGNLAAAASHLARCGFRRILIEKPVALWAEKIERLAEQFDAQEIEAACAYNRLAYPSLHELCARALAEGGITSCAYTFTEMIKPDWPDRFPSEELRRWGIANSLHVMSMAHGLIGLPASWRGYRSGSLPWHPTGSVFVGSGISDRGIPFAYHADWGSTGRWSIEVHTAVSSYRLCPLEKLFRRSSAMSEWEEIPLVAFNPRVKTGFIEQVAAMLNKEVRTLVPLVSLHEAALLTRFGEQVFGYAPSDPTI